MSGLEETLASCCNSETERCCWICLDGDGELVQPCSCPRVAHQRCIARWQLQNAGKAEEKTCRFCNATLPSWKSAFTPSALDVNPEQACPLMAVVFGDIVYKIPVRPGNEGQQEFRRTVKDLFGLDSGSAWDVTFECKTFQGDRVQLRGFECYDAATHCAAISAARRGASPSQSDSDDLDHLDSFANGTIHGGSSSSRGGSSSGEERNRFTRTYHRRHAAAPLHVNSARTSATPAQNRSSHWRWRHGQQQPQQPVPQQQRRSVSRSDSGSAWKFGSSAGVFERLWSWMVRPLVAFH